MKLNKTNSLVELFFEKYKEKKEFKNQPFLKWLKTDKNDFLTWDQVKNKICLLSEYLEENLSKGDRCILLSENRPEWLIADIAIMNAGGVTVPLFTTYSEKDYEYIINDCNPKICIVSNDIQFKKIEKFISNETKVISIENFDKKIKSISDILESNPKKETINICLFSEYLSKNLSKGDRCVLLSENRPEWLIADIAIMNSGGVTVPLFTTYSEKDYEYIINDCKPKICIISNDSQFKKLEKFKKTRVENRNQIIKSLKNDSKWNNQFNFIKVPDKILPSYMVLPIMINSN